MVQYMMTKQSGKGCVNKVKDGKQNKRVKTQPKKSSLMTPYEKVRSLQQNLLQEGKSVSQYKDYIQDKINKEKHFYNQLSKDDVDQLNKDYENLIQKDNNQLNLVEEVRGVKRKQRKNFREQRTGKMNDYKQKGIKVLFKELDKIPPGRGIVKTTHLSTNPKLWKETSNSLFTGGFYLLDSDKRWTSIYAKLSPMNSSALFDVVYGSEELQKAYLEVC
jgi:hypothetical protein